MIRNQWEKYNGALLWHGQQPPTATEARIAIKQNHALLARWTEDWDCGHRTEWWYCIQDKYIPLNQMSTKQRYRIRKGLQNTNIVHFKKLELEKYSRDLIQIAIDSFADYPEKYRPIVDGASMIQYLESFTNSDFWICYDITTNQPCGYGFCTQEGRRANLNQVKVPSVWLKNEVNAALAYTIMEYYLKEQHADMLVDGERNIRHETNYQDFLVRVLGFRYAYCRLHIEYSVWMKVTVTILFPFRKVICLLGKHNSFLYNIYCILHQEKIRRSFI